MFRPSVLQGAQAKQAEVEHLPKYVPVDEKEHKEASRTHKVDSARVYFYQVTNYIPVPYTLTKVLTL